MRPNEQVNECVLESARRKVVLGILSGLQRRKTTCHHHWLGLSKARVTAINEFIVGALTVVLLNVDVSFVHSEPGYCFLETGKYLFSRKNSMQSLCKGYEYLAAVVVKRYRAYILGWKYPTRNNIFQWCLHAI